MKLEKLKASCDVYTVFGYLDTLKQNSLIITNILVYQGDNFVK